ncbi:MAG: DUF4919 domain-containing protein [Muribaculaceae bacterium]|nr:DUF4919 domain-containing protein [Muribaculaceae bacterium]
MKHFARFILSLFVVSLAISMAQARPKKPVITTEAPNMERIKTVTGNAKSPYYFPKLMAKFMENDTLMAHEEYLYLYLGYVFQEDYDPYRHFECPKHIKDLYIKSELNRAEQDSVLKYAKMAINDVPFDLDQLNFLVWAYEKRQKKALAKIWQHKLDRLVTAIRSTGTGLDTENAWYVIYPSQEYFLLQKLSVTNSSFVEPYYECLSVKKQGGDTSDNYYFNIRYILEEYYRKHPQEK